MGINNVVKKNESKMNFQDLIATVYIYTGKFDEN